MSEVDTYSTIKQSRQMIFRGILPPGFFRELEGCVFHLGGEPILSRLLAFRFKYPLFFYGEGLPRFRFLFERIFLDSCDQIPIGKRSPKIKPVGSLMVDTSRHHTKQSQRSKSDFFTVGLFPGSRFYQVKHMLPFLTRVAGLVSEKKTDVRWMIAKSDYLSLEDLEEISSEIDKSILESEKAELQHSNSTSFLISEKGIRFEIDTSYAVMSQADAVLCLPGSNTAELASMGIPMIVLVPSQRPERLPIPGPAGYLDRLPFIGKYLKIVFVWLYWRRSKYLALPNRKAGKELVPEIVGRLTAKQVSDTFLEFIEQPLQSLSAELRDIMGSGGASDRLAEELLLFFEGKNGSNE
jgi:lipid-A-disaccharide synthase